MAKNPPFLLNNSGPRYAAFVLLLALTVVNSAALAQEPCSNLSAELHAQYDDLGIEALEEYEAENYLKAIEAILQMRRICAEDPILRFNLAWAYQKAGDCNLARYWFESSVDPSDPFVELMADREQAVAEALTELSVSCSDSALLSIECAQEQVNLSFAGEEHTCPYEGRVAEGSYIITASREGASPLELTAQVRATHHNHLVIPQLAPPLTPQPTTGQLTLSCPSTTNSVWLSGPAFPEGEAMSCPFSADLQPGEYQITSPTGEFSDLVQLRAGEQIAVRLHQPHPVPLDEAWGTAEWGLLVAGAGGTLSATGLGLFIAAELKRDEIGDPDERGPDGSVTSITRAEALRIEDDANDMDTAAWVTSSVGLALLTTGIVLYLLDEPEQAETSAATWVPQTFMSDEVIGLGAMGRF